MRFLLLSNLVNFFVDSSNFREFALGNQGAPLLQKLDQLRIIKAKRDVGDANLDIFIDLGQLIKLLSEVVLNVRLKRAYWQRGSHVVGCRVTGGQECVLTQLKVEHVPDVVCDRPLHCEVRSCQIVNVPLLILEPVHAFLVVDKNQKQQTGEAADA